MESSPVHPLTVWAEDLKLEIETLRKPTDLVVTELEAQYLCQNSSTPCVVNRVPQASCRILLRNGQYFI